MKKLYLFLFKILAYIEIYSGKGRVWLLFKMHEVKEKKNGTTR